MSEAPKKRHSSSQSAPCLYTLRIELHPNELQPPVWRRLVVDGRVSLAKLHHYLQAAMGWSDAHTHEFEIRGRLYGPVGTSEIVREDERKARLNSLLSSEDPCLYRYDEGDDWEHVITVEAFQQVDHDPDGVAWVIDGARACPPEDVGGIHGYHDFLETLLTRPHGKEAEELRLWAGGEFDPELFDRRAANAAIQRMVWNRWGGK